MDLNGDGLLDLVVGDANGVVHLFRNEGTLETPKLRAAEPLLVGGEPFKWPGSRIKPAVADWNNDGRFDQTDIIAALQAGNYMA